MTQHIIKPITQHEPAICPICNGENLHYEHNNNKIRHEINYYDDYKCDNCGFRGQECYTSTFLEHRIYDQHNEPGSVIQTDKYNYPHICPFCGDHDLKYGFFYQQKTHCMKHTNALPVTDENFTVII